MRVEVQLYSLYNIGARCGGWSTPRPGRFTPWKETLYPLNRRLGGPQGRSGQVRKILRPPGVDRRTFQPVASSYTDWAIRAQLCNIIMNFINLYWHLIERISWFYSSSYTHAEDNRILSHYLDSKSQNPYIKAHNSIIMVQRSVCNL